MAAMWLVSAANSPRLAGRSAAGSLPAVCGGGMGRGQFFLARHGGRGHEPQGVALRSHGLWIVDVDAVCVCVCWSLYQQLTLHR